MQYLHLTDAPPVCRNLTDMAVFELASIGSLRRLSLVRVHKLTDIAIFALAEHAIALERLHLCYCDRLSLDAVHLLLKKLDHLQHLTVTGIPSFKRRGVHRFSDPPPAVSQALALSSVCVTLRFVYGRVTMSINKPRSSSLMESMWGI